MAFNVTTAETKCNVKKLRIASPPPPLSENSDLSKKFHVSEIHRVIYTLLGCLFLCLFVSNKRENR